MRRFRAPKGQEKCNDVDCMSDFRKVAEFQALLKTHCLLFVRQDLPDLFLRNKLLMNDFEKSYLLTPVYFDLTPFLLSMVPMLSFI